MIYNKQTIMKHIDITFDFETCSTAPDAAPITLGAIVWNRNVELDNPFTEDTFSVAIDLRTCVTAGFSFDQDTINWWKNQNNEAKQSLVRDKCYAVDVAYNMFSDWIDAMKQKYNAETVCLWCQGKILTFLF